MKPLVIATRRSALARWQADHIEKRLRELTGRDVEQLLIVTKGDKILDVPLAMVGGKGLFVKEIEEALLDGRADIAVHSLKDVPTFFPEGLVLGAVTEREDPRDALCSPKYKTLDALPIGAKVGTSSLRRQAQLKALRPDLDLVNVRGNVQTRLSKTETECDGVILAYAGLKRLGLADQATDILSIERSLPAIGQGALGIEIREGDPVMGPIVAMLDHPETRAATTAERTLLAKLEGGCQVPIAAYATVEGGMLHLKGLVGRADGSEILYVERSGPMAEAEQVGLAAAEELLALGAGQILSEIVGTKVGVPH